MLFFQTEFTLSVSRCPRFNPVPSAVVTSIKIAGVTMCECVQIITADLNNRESLNDRFRANNWTGFIMFATVIAGKLLA